MLVTSDHGQSEVGWHTMLDEDSWTTLFITGKGIAQGRVLPYLEHIDIAPTTAWLLGGELPIEDNVGAGKPIKEVLEEYDFTGDSSLQYIKVELLTLLGHEVKHKKLIFV